MARSNGVVPLVGFGNTVAWIHDGTHLHRLALRRDEKNASRCAWLQRSNAEGLRHDQLTVLVPNADSDGRSGRPLESVVRHRDSESHSDLFISGQQMAVRHGNWKAIQPKKGQSWELYDLSKDISETTNIADDHPELLAKLEKFAAASHDPVQAGTYSDSKRTRHQRDRKAKFGFPTGENN